MFLWNDNPTAGRKKESVGCSSRETGAFERFKKTKNIKAIFVGHDHDNDYRGIMDDIELSYGRKTGFGSYGHLTRGARVITLKEKMDDKGNLDFSYENRIIENSGYVP